MILGLALATTLATTLAAPVASAAERAPAPEDCLQVGAQQREEGDWAQAAATFRAGLAQAPDQVHLRMELATTLAWLGQHQEALALYAMVAGDHEVDARLRAAARESHARVSWWAGRRDHALRTARALGATELAEDIAADRPRRLTLLVGARDGDRPLVGARGQLRRGPWTVAGSVDRNAEGWSVGQGEAQWSATTTVAHRVAEHLVAELGSRHWWSAQDGTHAVAGRSTVPVGLASPYLGAMVGPDLQVGEAGLRVGRTVWVSVGATYRPAADPLLRSTSLAGAAGARWGPVSVRADGSRGWFLAGPLDGVGGQLEVIVEPLRLGLGATRLSGWMTRTDVVGTCSWAF